MSLRLELAQVMRLAPRVLGEAAPLVVDFLRGEQTADGGFRDRSQKSDLYYTSFALAGLFALDAELEVEATARHLARFESGPELDLVHLCCLARCWAIVGDYRRIRGLAGPRLSADESKELLARIESYRSGDGGYHVLQSHPHASAYGCYLAVGAYEDLNQRVPDPQRIIDCINRLRTGDFGWRNEPPVPTPSTNATAAAAGTLRALGAPVDPRTCPWLLGQLHDAGGFLAAPQAPMPDLLSTATALHTLSSLGAPLEPIREGCLDFVDSLWSNAGGFYGHWADSHLDCEYTFYALLALGHLSV